MHRNNGSYILIDLDYDRLGTGVALYLSYFYPREDVGFRHSWFVCGSAISSAIAGSVACGIQQAKTSIASWRLIFIVEAAPTRKTSVQTGQEGRLADHTLLPSSVLVGIAVFLWLPDSIASARFLTPREKKIAEARLYRATIDVERTKEDPHAGAFSFIKNRLDVSNFVSALKDPFSYVSAILLFILNVGYSSIPAYLPVILQGMGYTRCVPALNKL
jgi:hypothetical protein